MDDWKKYESDKSQVFFCASRSLKYNDEIEKYLKSTSEYLHGFRELNKSHDWIFNLIFRKANKSPLNRNSAIANLAAARITLDRILILLPNGINEVLKEFLEDFICDIGHWIKVIDDKQNFSWLILNTNNSISHSYYYRVRQSLYGIDLKKYNTYDSLFINATLLIRHTIEQRIKGILGIDFINNSKNRPIGLSYIIEIFSKLEKLTFRKEIDIKRISKINAWANHYLHRGLRPAPWQLEWAEFELGKLFYLGETTDKKKLSIYASFETENLQDLRDEFELRLKRKAGNVTIRWRSDHEIYSKNLSEAYSSSPLKKFTLINKAGVFFKSIIKSVLKRLSFKYH